MVDAHGELIYVGKAKSLRPRMLSYFRPRSREPKAGRILARTVSLLWEYCPSEFAALHRELELIHRWRPRFNVHGQPHRRSLTYVCLGREPAPYAFLAVRPPARVLAQFGPVPAGERARQAVRRLNDWFQLRDCSQSQEMFFTEQAELFPMTRGAGCLRFELGTCLGPCVAACSRSSYRERVQAAAAFLAGTERTPLEILQREMNAASAALAFERAAELRDKRESLNWLSEQLKLLERARVENSFVYPVAGLDGKDLWYLIHGGRTVAVVLPPSQADCSPTSRKILEAVFRAPSPQPGVSSRVVNGDWYRLPLSTQHSPLTRNGPLTCQEMDGLFLITSWFRLHPGERQRVLDPTEAMTRLTQR
jgi:excinuclease ABC subunit C